MRTQVLDYIVNEITNQINNGLSELEVKTNLITKFKVSIELTSKLYRLAELNK
jgi:hypothetical protein